VESQEGGDSPDRRENDEGEQNKSGKKIRASMEEVIVWGKGTSGVGCTRGEGGIC